MALLTDKIFELYRKNFAGDADLRRYEKELASTDKAIKNIKNILTAIEEGIFTPSTKQRLTELEEKKTRHEQAITADLFPEQQENFPQTKRNEPGAIPNSLPNSLI